MHKKLSFFYSLLLVLLCGVSVQAQTYTMITSNIITCGGTYLDPGGSGSYANNQSIVQTITPVGPNDKLVINFNSFNTESCCDGLTIYDGNSTAAPIIGTYRGSTLPPGIRSTAADGSLTFRFTSDGSVTGTGWQASFSCCNGATAGTPTSNISTICAGENFQIVMNGTCGTIQWQSSTDNLNWSNIAASGSVINITQNESSYYRGIATLNTTSDTSVAKPSSRLILMTN